MPWARLLGPGGVVSLPPAGAVRTLVCRPGAVGPIRRLSARSAPDRHRHPTKLAEPLAAVTSVSPP